MKTIDPTPVQPRRHHPARRRMARASLVAIGLLFVAIPAAPPAEAQGCGLRYVATGDDIPAGHDVSESERYPNHLVDDHLKKWGAWCEYDIAKEGTTSVTEITGGQLAQTWNYRPDLITLTIGE